LREIIRQSEIEREVLEREGRLVEAHIVPMKDMEEIDDDDIVDVSVQIVKKEHEFRPDPDRFYSSILNRLPKDMRMRWRDIDDFVGHDIANIEHFALRIHAEHVGMCLGYSRNALFTMRNTLDGEWDGFYREIFAEYMDIFRQIYYPHQFAKAVAELELGREVSEVEYIDLQKLVYVIARSIQLRQFQDDYVLTTPKDRQEDRNEIILNLNESSLETNPGMIWSIIYNLMKNASKELSCSNNRDKNKSGISVGRPTHDLRRRIEEGELPQAPIKLYVKTEELVEPDLTLIHVADSGKGLQLDEIMNSLKAIIENEMLHETDLKKRVKKILASWQKNPFAIRALRLGEVLDMAGIARLSGFATRYRLRGQMSSGMGLWGAEYLSSKMGGEIIYTNTVDGGAMFTVIVPNHYLRESGGGTGKRQIKNTVRRTRKALEAGDIPIDFAA